MKQLGFSSFLVSKRVQALPQFFSYSKNNVSLHFR